jgi:DNA repair exonuclease SbcCD ATPase subunit
MMNEMSNYDFREMTQDARRVLEHEQEKLTEKVEQMDGLILLLKSIERRLEDNQKLQEEIEILKQQLSEEKKQRAELEMKMAEMSKLSAGVAKKASYDELLKAIRIYTNKSKQKTLSKRTAIKIMIMELANTASLVFPPDLAETIERLDDEQSEQKVVNVTMHSPKIDGPLYGISHNENVNLGGRIHG